MIVIRRRRRWSLRARWIVVLNERDRGHAFATKRSAFRFARRFA